MRLALVVSARRIVREKARSMIRILTPPRAGASEKKPVEWDGSRAADDDADDDDNDDDDDDSVDDDYDDAHDAHDGDDHDDEEDEDAKILGT